MPKYRIERMERGERYRTIEVEAPTKEEAQEMIWNDEGTVVSETFKPRDCETLSWKEVPPESSSARV